MILKIARTNVNGIAKSLSEVFNSSSKACFGSVKYSKFQNSVKKSPHWFNGKCKKARNDFHKAKSLYKLRHTDVNKHKVKTSVKNYKRTLATEQNLFKLSKIEQLRKIKTSDPRKFWIFLNGNEKNTSNISVEKCFESLARLHEVQKSYCSHPGRTRSRSRSRYRYRYRSRHTLLKFFRSLYLNNQLSKSIHT